MQERDQHNAVNVLREVRVAMLPRHLMPVVWESMQQLDQANARAVWLDTTARRHLSSLHVQPGCTVLGALWHVARVLLGTRVKMRHKRLLDALLVRIVQETRRNVTRVPQDITVMIRLENVLRVLLDHHVMMHLLHQ